MRVRCFVFRERAVTRTLILNTDFSPLTFVSDKRAIVLVYIGRAEIVDMGGRKSLWDDEYFTSPGKNPGELVMFPVPATIKMFERVNKKRQTKPRCFRKKDVFMRDAFKCQYCTVQLTWETVTIDHVIPTSRGGGTNWFNCVTACKHCNKRKANRMSEEVEMHPLKKPVEPTYVNVWEAPRAQVWHEDWTELTGTST